MCVCALQGDCLSEAVQLYENVLPAVLAQATPGADTAPLGLALAPEGSLEQKHALGCLQHVLLGLRTKLWSVQAATVLPQQLVRRLTSSVWGAVRSRDEALLRLLVAVLQALAQALLPYLEESEIDDLLQESDEEQDAAGAASGYAAEGKQAALACLQLLLVQLAGNAAVPSLIRGLALEVSCCASVPAAGLGRVAGRLFGMGGTPEATSNARHMQPSQVAASRS